MSIRDFSPDSDGISGGLPDPVRADMAALDRLILAQLESDASLIRHVGEHIINAGGKRVRPLLVLLMARLFGYEGTQHHTLAAIIEFIHTASLLHDDVVDDSARRRGVESANARFGNAASVLVGDFMHTRAFQLMLSVNNMSVMQVLADATNTIAEGEVLQLMNVCRTDVGEAAYFRIIYAKTARLFEAAAVLGAIVASASPSHLEAASACGRQLGMAFQLADDALDYAGDAAVLGKNPGDDLREGKMTLPLIHLMATGSESARTLVREYMEGGVSGHFGAILDAVRQGGSLEYTAKMADEAARAAAKAAALLPDNAYREGLLRLCAFASGRRF